MGTDSPESVLDLLASRGQDGLLDEIYRLRAERDHARITAGFHASCHDCGKTCADDDPQLCEACARRDVEEERDELASIREHLDHRLLVRVDEVQRLRTERDEALAEVERLRVGLVEALEIGVYTPERLAILRKLAGVRRG